MKKYQVFVSSTYEDLKQERLGVINTLLDNDCIPVGMEQFPASGAGIMDYIIKVLNDCDYYILIIAGRYGSVDTDQVGFTEKEFDYAKSIGIPILVFYYDNIGKLEQLKCESTLEGKQKLEIFRKKAMYGSLAKKYSSIDDLKAQVATSINKAKSDTPMPGWIRSNSVQESNSSMGVQYDDDFTLVDSFPKINSVISYYDLKNIYFKFSKPIEYDSLCYIQFKFIRINTSIQLNIAGFFELTESDTKAIWHISNHIRSNQDFFPSIIEAPTSPLFIVNIGFDSTATLRSQEGTIFKPLKFNVYFGN